MMLGVFLTTVAFAAVQALAANESLVLNISLEDGSNKIFVGEKTIFNVTVKFPGAYYDDVIIDVLPTIDLPDVFLTNVKTVKVGSDLLFSGSTKPVMDYGRPELQTPGKALSCQFHLGNVVKSRKPREWALSQYTVLQSAIRNYDSRKPAPVDDVVFIQYEALIPEVRSEGFAEIGHNHMYAVGVSTGMEHFFMYKHVKVAARSLPILFRTLEKFPSKRGVLVQEMNIEKTAVNGKMTY